MRQSYFKRKQETWAQAKLTSCTKLIEQLQSRLVKADADNSALKKQLGEQRVEIAYLKKALVHYTEHNLKLGDKKC